MDQTVNFGDRDIPAWPAVRALLTSLGYPVQVRMIDGELAFPDEEPPETWRELRLGAAGGMVTLRRSGAGVTFVTWGNADPAQRQLWNGLTWAFAEAGGGVVQTEQGIVDASAFRRAADLPQVLRT
jgi:hypothetical protein